jgi:hypothetical protein
MSQKSKKAHGQPSWSSVLIPIHLSGGENKLRKIEDNRLE